MVDQVVESEDNQSVPTQDVETEQVDGASGSALAQEADGTPKEMPQDDASQHDSEELGESNKGEVDAGSDGQSHNQSVPTQDVKTEQAGGGSGAALAQEADGTLKEMPQDDAGQHDSEELGGSNNGEVDAGSDGQSQENLSANQDRDESLHDIATFVPDVDRGEESSLPREPDSDEGVMIQSETWVPPFESLSHQIERRKSSPSEDFVQCRSCFFWNGPGATECEACQAAIHFERALSCSKLATDKRIVDAIESLRKSLRESFQGRRIADGDVVLQEKLLEMSVEGALDSSTFVEAMKALGVHVMKRELRPLLAHPLLTQHGSFEALPMASTLNAEMWWPSEDMFESEDAETGRLRRELDELLGPKLATTIAGDQSKEYVQELLDQVKKDRNALEELKSFLDVIPMESRKKSPIEEFSKKDRLEQTRSPSPAMQQIPRPRSSVDVTAERGSLRSSSSMRRSQAISLPKTTKPYVEKLETKAPTVKQKWPHGRLSTDILPKSDVEWKTWEDRKTGKIHAPMPIPLSSLGSSRRRGLEFHRSFAKATEDSRKSMNHSSDFWKTLPSPCQAVTYLRWDMLEQPIAGFSSPKMIPPKRHEDPWTKKIFKFPFKFGSRYCDPIVDGTVEQLKPTSMLTDDLKHERSKSKLVLEGTETMKRMRVNVVKGCYDRALQDTEMALNKYKSAGKYGEALAKDLGDTEGKVVSLIKLEVDKLLKVAKDALERNYCDRAMSHVPRLQKAVTWLHDHGVVYPEAREATHWEIRMRVPTDSFPEGMAVIDLLKDEIEEREQALAISLDSVATASFFAAVQPVLDLSDPDQLAEVDEATKRKNKVPDKITADGRTHLLVVDLKPPDLPKGGKLKTGTLVQVRGERVLGSEKQPDPEEWMCGTVVSWNNRMDKFKVQYDDDYEWIMIPSALEIEINTYPEDVMCDLQGFTIRSITQEHPSLGKRVAVVAFTVVPQGPPYDLTSFGESEITTTGLKSKKVLLEGESARTMIVPPTFLQTASSYRVVDSLTAQDLDGELEFIHSEDKTTTKFAPGEPVKLEKDGVYRIVARGRKDVGYPWTTDHSTCVWLDSIKDLERGEVKVHLNKHMAQADEMRVVVSWEKSPSSLDSHIYTSERDKVDWQNSGKWVNGIKLDIDSTCGFGPETTTIRVKKGVGYSFSLRMVDEGEGLSDTWTASNAKVTLFDHTGAFAVLQLPPARQGMKGMWWWHVFALDGNLWDRPGHGMLRVNQLATHELSQLAVPGWTMMEAARKGLWEEMCEHLTLYGCGKTPDQPALLPRQIANAVSMEGETLLGLVCLHNEGTGEEVGLDEKGQSPLNKQIEALNMLLKWTVKLEKRVNSTESQNGGIPTEDALSKECKVRGVRDCYIYRAVMYASADVAVSVLNLVGVVVKRSMLSSKLRCFFHKNGDDLLDVCVHKRSVQSLVQVLTALLGIEAVWERKSKRSFQEKDRVKVEVLPGSGKWYHGVIAKRTYDGFKIQLTESRRDMSVTVAEEEGETGEIELMGDAQAVSSHPHKQVEVVPARLKWQTPALERAKQQLYACQQEVKSLEFGSVGHGMPPKARQLLQAETAYKRAVALLSEKAFEPSEKAFEA